MYVFLTGNKFNLEASGWDSIAAPLCFTHEVTHWKLKADIAPQEPLEHTFYLYNLIFLEGFAVLFQFRGRRNAQKCHRSCCVWCTVLCFCQGEASGGTPTRQASNWKKRWACLMLDLRNVKGQTNNGSYMHVPENACLVSFMHAW